MQTLITGGTSGIGAAIAVARAAAGDNVWVTGSNPERLAAFLAARPEIRGITADAGDWGDTRRAVAEVRAACGGLDLVVANAGFSARGDLASGDPVEWERMVTTNVLGPAYLVRAALPALILAAGHIVLIGSSAGRKVFPGNLYTATKWAVTAYAESLRQQLVGTGVRVTLLSPGAVETPLWAERPDAWMPPERVAAALDWAVSQPADVDVSELIIRATGQAF
ncbi:SDR family oxidoreductase [Leucobacter luti]|uniref:SDR family oxidoreductase n=1 Tax=Leucobacter luti TaxID=340320 RepID=UPI001C692033|nr:SDR family NAD(P)-dependent oxidoreductase [Leucobacter luti]QYM76604.1 SDR family NAD(P)-dependent oxidoreductase [Leucobacter luti]